MMTHRKRHAYIFFRNADFSTANRLVTNSVVFRFPTRMKTLRVFSCVASSNLWSWRNIQTKCTILCPTSSTAICATSRRRNQKTTRDRFVVFVKRLRKAFVSSSNYQKRFDCVRLLRFGSNGICGSATGRCKARPSNQKRGKSCAEASALFSELPKLNMHNAAVGATRHMASALYRPDATGRFSGGKINMEEKLEKPCRYFFKMVSKHDIRYSEIWRVLVEYSVDNITAQIKCVWNQVQNGLRGLWRTGMCVPFKKGFF